MMDKRANHVFSRIKSGIGFHYATSQIKSKLSSSTAFIPKMLKNSSKNNNIGYLEISANWLK
jgi:hypothetical protein